MLSDKNNEMWKRVQYDNINKRNVLFTRKSAFTLAEVLITLGVIGVVAAMTIPTLIHNYKAKEMRTRLLRANSIIQDGIGRMVADEVNISDILKIEILTRFVCILKTGVVLFLKTKKRGIITTMMVFILQVVLLKRFIGHLIA